MSAREWFELIRREALARYPALLQEWLPGGRIEGNEFVAGSVAGEPGNSLKVNIRTSAWADFARAGVSGNDAISLFAAINKLSYKDAGKELGILLGLNRPLGVTQNPWVPMATIPDYAPMTAEDFPVLPPSRMGDAAPTAMWCYLNADGVPLCWRVRFDRPDGSKDVLPLTFCQNMQTGATEWRWRDLPAPRPLYGLELLALSDDAPLIIVEGEKTADAARQLLPDWICVTWAGGVRRIGPKFTDWGPILNRGAGENRPRLVLWPDADAEGRKAMFLLEEYFREVGLRPEIVRFNPAWAKGWDLADALAEGWDTSRVLAYISENAVAVTLAEKPLSKRPGVILWS